MILAIEEAQLGSSHKQSRAFHLVQDKLVVTTIVTDAATGEETHRDSHLILRDEPWTSHNAKAAILARAID